MRAIITLLIALFATHVHAQLTPGKNRYTKTTDTVFTAAGNDPKATIPVSAGIASYADIRRTINSGVNPVPGSIHIEEMINYFDYKYPQPTGDAAIAINTELTNCPWNKDHKLLRVGIQARKTNAAMLPASNLVFLVGVSGTMPDNKKLLVDGMKKLVSRLRPKDKVAIVTYGNADRLVLPATSGFKKDVLFDALDKLVAGEPATGDKGIALAYKMAQEKFIKDGNNRIILISDGSLPPGTNSDSELESLITQKQAEGIYLTCLSLGTASDGNNKEMAALSAKGHGNYKYLEDAKEVQDALFDELYGTQLTIAKEVNAQIHFNPARVAAYRMIGYEEDPQDEKGKNKSTSVAGTMNAGHQATILFEIIPVITEQGTVAPAANKDLAAIKCKYKKPGNDIATEINHVIPDRTVQWDNTSENTRFATAVAILGMLLSDSKHAYNTCFEDAMKFARGAMDYDEDGYREEFVKLVKRAKNNDIDSHPVK